MVRGQIIVLQQLQNLRRTAEAAGLEDSVLDELQKAFDIVHAQNREFWQGDGRFWNHMWRHVLFNSQGFEIKTIVKEPSRFAACLPSEARPTLH